MSARRGKLLADAEVEEEAAVKAYEKGLFSAIGVSNYCTQCLQCLKDFATQPMVNQFQLHVGMGPDPQGFLAMNAARGIVSQAYSPIGSGGQVAKK